MCSAKTNYSQPDHYPKKWFKLSLDEKNKKVMELIDQQIKQSQKILTCASNSREEFIDEIVSLFPFLQNTMRYLKEHGRFERHSNNLSFNLDTKNSNVRHRDSSTRIQETNESSKADKNHETNEKNIQNNVLEIRKEMEKVSSEESSDDSTIKTVESLENSLVANVCSVKMYRDRCFEDYSQSSVSTTKEKSKSGISLPNRKKNILCLNDTEDIQKQNHGNPPADFSLRENKLTWKPQFVKIHDQECKEPLSAPSTKIKTAKLRQKTLTPTWLNSNKRQCEEQCEELTISEKQETVDLKTQSLKLCEQNNAKKILPCIEEESKDSNHSRVTKIMIGNNKKVLEQKHDIPLFSDSREPKSTLRNKTDNSCQNLKLPLIPSKLKSGMNNQNKPILLVEQNVRRGYDEGSRRAPSRERCFAAFKDKRLLSSSCPLLDKSLDSWSFRNTFLSGSTDSITSKPYRMSDLKDYISKSSKYSTFTTPSSIRSSFPSTALREPSVSLKPQLRLPPFPRRQCPSGNLLIDIPLKNDMDTNALEENNTPMSVINLQ